MHFSLSQNVILQGIKSTRGLSSYKLRCLNIIKFKFQTILGAKVKVKQQHFIIHFKL